MKNLLKEGDIIELDGRHIVYAEVPKHFVYANRRGDFTLTNAEARLKYDEFDYLRGRYVVIRTAMDGGGGRPEDYFPDGHHVFCESLDRKYKVDFYQTGAFTAMNPDIDPVGRAELKWVVDGEVWATGPRAEGE